MVETEYVASDGRITIATDELLFVKQGRLSRALQGADAAWHIPIACIRDVVFKDSKTSGGFIHLVIGTAETPKASLWGIADKPWTLQFRYGKQAKSFRALHQWLLLRIDANRQAGIDPASARHPYVDGAGARELNEMKQKILGNSLVEATDTEARPADVIALAKQAPAYSSFYSDLDSLSQRLRENESLQLLAQGMSGAAPVLLALTDQRVIVHADSAMVKLREESDLPVQASWKASPLSSTLTFRSGSHEVAVGAIGDAVAERFLELIN